MLLIFFVIRSSHSKNLLKKYVKLSWNTFFCQIYIIAYVLSPLLGNIEKIYAVALWLSLTVIFLVNKKVKWYKYIHNIRAH